jgi:hypothetical protein
MIGIPFLRCEGCGGMVLLCDHHLADETLIGLRKGVMANGHSSCRSRISDLRRDFIPERMVARAVFDHMEAEERKYKRLLKVYWAKKRADERASRAAA